jgi:hypothetical protein
MRTVVIESPYRPMLGKATVHAGLFLYHQLLQRNIDYCKKAIKDCLDRNESPYASHLLLTQVLNDNIYGERKKGLEASHQWIYVADLVAFYIDHGYSEGMLRSLELCKRAGLKHEEREILISDKELLNESSNYREPYDRF